MRDYESFFSEKEIVRYLAQKRAKAAKDIHDNQFLRNISKNAEKPFDPENRKNIYKYFPPRNDWIRFRKRERKSYNNSKSLNAAQIERTVWREHKRVMKGAIEAPEWYQEMFGLIDEIQDKALNYSSKKRLSSPKLIPVVKNEAKNTYRLICSFESLCDRVLITQSSRYLTEIFDPLFEECSFAFRSKHNEKKFTHHLAVREIIEYKSKYDSQRLYASECDIQKFYDSINHSVIRKCFQNLIGILRTQNINVDKRAINLFNAYLDCYAFNEDVYPKEKKILKKHGIKKGRIAWVAPLDLKSVGSKIEEGRIGVPQGGALSCLIANIVLDFADKKILDLNFSSLFYARFCDDIIIIHSRKKKCRKAYDEYLKSLKELKLIAHPAEYFKTYNANFWGIKTKEPYVWNRVNKNHRLAKKNVPWLAFVGYQLRYDGLLRVRPDSIQKELEKQVEEANKVIESLPDENSKRLNKKNIIFRFSQRLIAMSVGRVNSENPSMCWASGFNVLKDNPVRKWQLRKLDKNRNLQISRIKNHLKDFNDSTSNGYTKEDQPRYRDYYGPPYSYYYQFLESKKNND
jgi:hypothetical protein